jgi:hypothetical protein
MELAHISGQQGSSPELFGLGMDSKDSLPDHQGGYLEFFDH